MSSSDIPSVSSPKNNTQKNAHFFTNEIHREEGKSSSRVCVDRKYWLWLAPECVRYKYKWEKDISTLYAATHSNMHSPTTTNSITNSCHPKLLSTQQTRTNTCTYTRVQYTNTFTHNSNQPNKAIDRLHGTYMRQMECEHVCMYCVAVSDAANVAVAVAATAAWPYVF